MFTNPPLRYDPGGWLDATSFAGENKSSGSGRKPMLAQQMRIFIDQQPVRLQRRRIHQPAQRGAAVSGIARLIETRNVQQFQHSIERRAPIGGQTQQGLLPIRERRPPPS